MRKNIKTPPNPPFPQEGYSQPKECNSPRNQVSGKTFNSRDCFQKHNTKQLALLNAEFHNKLSFKCVFEAALDWPVTWDSDEVNWQWNKFCNNKKSPPRTSAYFQ